MVATIGARYLLHPTKSLFIIRPQFTSFVRIYILGGTAMLNISGIGGIFGTPPLPISEGEFIYIL